MSTGQATLERIKAHLQASRDIGGNMPQDLYSHLTEVFNRILLHHSSDAFDKFEEISALIKQTNLKIKDPRSDAEVNQVHRQPVMTEAQQWIQKSKNLLNEVSLIHV